MAAIISNVSSSSSQIPQWMTYPKPVIEASSYLSPNEIFLLTNQLCRKISNSCGSLKQRISILSSQLKNLTALNETQIDEYVQIFEKIIKNALNKKPNNISTSISETEERNQVRNGRVVILEGIATRCLSLQEISINFGAKIFSNSEKRDEQAITTIVQITEVFNRISSLKIEGSKTCRPMMHLDLKQLPALPSLTRLNISVCRISSRRLMMMKFRNLTDLNLQSTVAAKSAVESTLANHEQDMSLPFSNLVRLNLNNADLLTGIASSTLQYLNLRLNQRFTNGDLSRLANHSSLTHLDISMCTKTKGAGTRYINNLFHLRMLPCLRVLDLSNNSVTQHALDHLNRNLQDLDISACEITNLGFLEPLANLRRLNLSDNDPKNLIPLTSLKLQDLNISGCRLSHLHVLSSLFTLTHLNVSYNPITDLRPLIPLTNLTHLNISRCHVEDFEPLERQTELSHLDLSFNLPRNTMTLLDLRFVKALPKLKYLNLTGCRVSIESLEELVSFFKKKYNKDPVIIPKPGEHFSLYYRFGDVQLVLDRQQARSIGLPEDKKGPVFLIS